jgi:hypothetical protein
MSRARERFLTTLANSVAPAVLLGIALLIASGSGCSKKEEPVRTTTPTSPATVKPSASTAPQVSNANDQVAPANPHGNPAELGIDWTDPPEWKRVQPKSSMRKASYEIPASGNDKEPGELSVFYFGPSEGGGVEDNIKRWVGQFEGLKPDAVQRSERSVNDLTQYIVEVESGSYSGTAMGPHAPAAPKKENQGLLGAVIEAPTGRYFFKLSGPSATVKAARDPFFKLLDSIKAKAK